MTQGRGELIIYILIIINFLVLIGITALLLKEVRGIHENSADVYKKISNIYEEQKDFNSWFKSNAITYGD